MTPRTYYSLVLAAATLTSHLSAEETTTNSPVPAASAKEGVVDKANDLDNLSKGEILKLIRGLSDELKQTRSELQQLKDERNTEKGKTNAVPVSSVPPQAVSPAPSPVPVPVAKTEEPPEVDKEQQRLERERAIRSVQRSGVLLPKGKLELEPSFTYSHFSSNLIDVDGFSILPVLVVGQIQSLRIERDIFQSSLALRYGLLNNLQADVTVPYRYEEDRFVRQSASQGQQTGKREEMRMDEGIGDVQFGLSRQLLHEHGVVPDLILSATGRAPTGKSQFDIGNSKTELPQGTGVWAVRGGITTIKSLDPAVLIFSGGYTYNFGRDFTVTQVTSSSTNSIATSYVPGGTIDVGVSVAVAMNPSFAINLGIQERYTFSTYLTHIGTIQGTSLNEADIRFGFAWALSRNTVLNFTAAAGLTEDTPDLTVTLALPIKF